MSGRRGQSLEEFAKQNPTVRGPKCGVALSKFRKDIEAGQAKGIGDTTIAKWLKTMGEPVPYYTLGKHRRKECRCG